MLVLIRGAGDIATGIAMRLWRAGVQVVMTDLPQPTAIRRTVCFSQAIVLGETQVEDATARRAVDVHKSDDASVYKVSDELALVQTLDFFPPIADDPYTFGQIAATNALSDIYAMGGDPKLALNIMCVPEDMPEGL